MEDYDYSSEDSKSKDSPESPLPSEIPKSGLHELALKGADYYKNIIGLSPTDFIDSSNKYKQLGQYEYCGTSYTGDLYQKVGCDNEGRMRIYIGQFICGTEISDGIGITVFADGCIHEGYYKNDIRQGQGRYIHRGGIYYTGSFSDGKKHGKGMLDYGSGKIFRGNFVYNKREGNGAMTHPNGKTKKGVWKNDKLVS